MKQEKQIPWGYFLVADGWEEQVPHACFYIFPLESHHIMGILIAGRPISTTHSLRPQACLSLPNPHANPECLTLFPHFPHFVSSFPSSLRGLSTGIHPEPQLTGAPGSLS